MLCASSRRKLSSKVVDFGMLAVINAVLATFANIEISASYLALSDKLHLCFRTPKRPLELRTASVFSARKTVAGKNSHKSPI